MKNVDELQSYMIHRAEEFLNSKDRKLIGWDEILEGGLAPEATVMSWRGEDGGIKSARMGHDVVMTPGNYMYLDFYQADPKTQPYAIGGYTPIKKVYSYDPVPADSLTAEECRHILGVQANTWTEYIQTPEHLEYMMFPRALAVAEIGWTPQELRTWEDFKPRMNAHISKLQGMGSDHAGRYGRQKDRSHTGCREIPGGNPLHDGRFRSGGIFRPLCRADNRARFRPYQSCYFPGRCASGDTDGKESGLSSGHQ